MECDEEEETNSLLSLSQTFLQPDNSASTMGLSTNQIHNWSALAPTTTDVAAQFSPISPADGYSTNSSSGQTIIDHGANFRFYNSRSANNQSTIRGSVSTLFNRSGNSAISSANNLNSFPPSTNRIGDNEFNHNSGHMNIDTNDNLCYEQPCNLRPGSNIYGDKDNSYSNRGINIISSNSHALDDSNVITASFGHTGYSEDHVMLSLTSTSDDDDSKLRNRNAHIDQKMFGARTKQKEYNSKDFSSLYDQSSEKSFQTNEMSMTFDRRDTNNFDSSFEFSSDSRDFTTARLDVSSINRVQGDQSYHQSQKYQTTQIEDSDMLSNTLALDSKRIPSSYVNFGLSAHMEDGYGRLNNSQKKSFNQQLSDLPSDLEPVFHGYHTDFGQHQKLLLDNHRSFGTNEFQDSQDSSRFNIKDEVSSRDISNKWSGRPRAHRKMARLLGSEDYSQGVDASSSHKSSFTKSISSVNTATQHKNSFQPNIQRDLASSSRTFLTMEEELDLRTSHHDQKNFMTRRDEIPDRTQTSRDLGLLQSAPTFSFDPSAMASVHKDNASSILGNQQFLPSAQLDLDFHATLSVSHSQKDLELSQHFGLQVSKDFGLETGHPTTNQDDLSFDHSGEAQHMSQHDLTLSDNLGLVSQVQSEISFDAYFNSATDRDFTSAADRDFSSASDKDFMFCKKFSTSASKDLNYVSGSTVNDFNFEDYMNPQRDLSQSYFKGPDLPQDMTLYQKTPNEKTPIPETSNVFKGRDKIQGLTSDKDKQGEISELQKELTKSSTKESMKGIRIPRDINRAMEILQGLQEDEREEQRRKEIQQKQQNQQLQILVSSPKKAFQNKHNIESLSIADQQFLGSSGNFIEDQSVGSFLDHSHLAIPDQPQDSLQMVQSYQPFTQINQSIEVDMVSSIPSKRDLQQSLTQNVTSDLDYQILKRLACSTSIRGITKNQSSNYSNNSNNLASLLAEPSTHDLDMSFPETAIHFQTQQPDLEDVMSNNILNNNSNTTLELNKSKGELSFIDFEPQQHQHIINESLQTSLVTNDPHHPSGDFHHPSLLDVTQTLRCKQEAEVLIMSRKNLYDMMKREQFCDAVLSTSKQTVKVHQVVLCSMSQYLTTLLNKMKQSSTSSTSKGITQTSSCPSQTTMNYTILLVVNCDSIKTSSMMTFLLFIYLGRAELNESNVLDIYMLACSLRVLPLKNLCKDFMWQAHISNEQLKIPQLLVTFERINTQDQTTATEIITDEKSTNTPCFVRGMEVATQTDRSTSEAGEGGQEEWVMLKKTKQKTVSPSKSRLMVKSLTSIDSPIGCKSGKKGWLSPKRRYKTENQIEGKTTDKETAVICKDTMNFLPSTDTNIESKTKLDAIQIQCLYSSTFKPKTNDGVQETVSQNVEACEKTQPTLNKQMSNSKKATRTTVEIAAAAAAAKLAAHSYGTRTARGIAKLPVSYATLAFGLERKKVFSTKEKTVLTMSKKKDFIKANPDSEFCSQNDLHTLPKADHLTMMLRENIIEPNSAKTEGTSSEIMLENVNDNFDQLKVDGDALKLKAKQPFKKSIVHRSRSEDVLNKNYSQLVSTLPTIKADANESDFIDSDFIDSIVSTIKCVHADDFQKAISDLNNLSKSPVLTASSSSVSSTSLTSPLKSPAVLLSTPDSSSPPKLRSTPQGFRKRLIHQINCEKNAPSIPQSVSSPISIQSDQILLDKLDVAVFSTNTTTASSVSLSSTLSIASSIQTLTSSVVTYSEETTQNILSLDKISERCKQISDNLPTSISMLDTITMSTSMLDTLTSSISMPDALPMSISMSYSIQPSISMSDTLHLSTSDTIQTSISMLDTLQPSISESNTLPLSTSEMHRTFTSISDTLPTCTSMSNALPLPMPTSEKVHLPPHFTESVEELTLSLYSLGEETDLVLDSKACSFSSMTDIDLGLREDPQQQFMHKIYKRKRRFKSRKSITADGDNKTKTKKLPPVDAEGALSKPRLRKSISCVDSEGGASRTKQKKNVFSVNEEMLAKVRPPPKKRAKMELVMLQAEDPEKHQNNKGGSGKCEVAGMVSESKKERDNENSKSHDVRYKADFSSIDAMKESVNLHEQKSITKKAQKNVKADDNDGSHISEIETETKLILMLKQLKGTSEDKSNQFSCKLCQTKFRSACRTIKHMNSHGIPHEKALENISIETKESVQEDCDVCGYKTKDQSYHYMHIHKYFKHGVPLPLGWSTDKCEVCGKECFNKFQLKEHMMCHDDSHSFVCSHCGQSFKMRNGLNSHIFHKHCDVRKHPCKVCEKTFKTWTQLKVHVRSHTGERPFACTDCGHRSTTQGNMKLHLSTHGYSKEVIHGLMEQISKNVPDMKPETLEKVMLSIAEKPKGEQVNGIDKKRVRKPAKVKTNLEAQPKPDNTSPSKMMPSNCSKKSRGKKDSRDKKKTVSKFAGSHIERLLTQPLNELKPPTFILPQTSQPPLVNISNNSNSNEENIHSQMFCDSNDSGLGALSLLLQQQSQKQETNALSGDMFFILLSGAEQRQQEQQQQQQQQQQKLQQVAPMMGYTMMPSHALPGHSSTDPSLVSSTCLTLPVLSVPDTLSSGMNLVHSGIQSLQLVQADGVYPSISTSSGVSITHDSDPTHFLNSSQGHEILQASNHVANLQYPDSKSQVVDTIKQDAYTDNVPSLISTSGSTVGTTIMVLPNMTTLSQSQHFSHQVPTIFSYPSVISSNQSVLLTSTSDLQIPASNLDTGNFVNFSIKVAAPEEIVTLNISQQDMGNVTEQADNFLI